jgi:hypothetical protein
VKSGAAKGIEFPYPPIHGCNMHAKLRESHQDSGSGSGSSSNLKVLSAHHDLRPCVQCVHTVPRILQADQLITGPRSRPQMIAYADHSMATPRESSSAVPGRMGGSTLEALSPFPPDR